MKKSKPFLASFFRRVKNGPASLKSKSQKYYTRTYEFSKRRPQTAFFTLLLILLVFIALGNVIRKPKTEDIQEAKNPIAVETFSIGSAPRITVSAQVEKEGVVQIVAQTAGIVNKVNVKDGQTVKRGQNLISLSSNYQGANAASVQRQLAGVQAQTARITLDAQKEIIAGQRDIANRSDVNADDLRSITQKSVDETKSLVSLNESILTTIEANIKTLESTNVGGANDALILQTKQLQSQFLAGTNQSRSALRASEVQANDNNASISNLQKEITTKQLDLQEKTLKLNLDAANLQVRLAQISESLMFPASPFAGTVERVHVRAGQQVTPGTLLATISSAGKSQTAVSYVPRDIAQGISKLDASFLILDDQKYEAMPAYVSQEAVNGQLYAVIYSIPQDLERALTDKGFIDIEIPVGYSYTSQSVPYIPIDSVHQTQDKSVVFVIKDDKAEGKVVKLGLVQGNFIEITSGLEENDQIILSRNIVSGDPVKPKTQ